jgi:hypothetical protein
MITTQLLGEWALRSSILILSGTLLLRVFRVKDPSIRLAAWTALLCGSLAIPVLSSALPKPQFTSIRMPVETALANVDRPVHIYQNLTVPKRFDIAEAAIVIYFLGAGALLLRLSVGLLMSRHLLGSSCATGITLNEIEVRESDRVGAPVTLGIFHCAIVLPADWREWETAKLDAVLAHERSHILRRDPAVQVLSAIHRALVWHNPLSWYLHRRIVRVAEEASDDAAVAVTLDRATYAEILLDFMQRAPRGHDWHGVAMARYGRPDERIHRILDETSLSRGIGRWSMTAILAVVSPLAYMVATAHPQSATTTVTRVVESASAQEATPQTTAQTTTTSTTAREAAPRFRRYMIVSPNQMTGSWDSSDRDDPDELRARFGANFAWFRQGLSDYVITDAGVLDELRQAMAPQTEVNRMQEKVNDLQEVVNRHQEDVNRAQGEVNAKQEQVNHRQDLVNQLQSARNDEERIQKMSAALAELKSKQGVADQDAVNREQSKVNDLQHGVNEEQHKVNDEQEKVNVQQRIASAKVNKQIDQVFDSAIRRHLAEKIQ